MLIAKNLRSEKMQLIGNNRIGSLGKIRTSNPSVNSGRGGKSKCRVWCRLQEKRSHFSCFSCTQCCTQLGRASFSRGAPRHPLCNWLSVGEIGYRDSFYFPLK